LNPVQHMANHIPLQYWTELNINWTCWTSSAPSCTGLARHSGRISAPPPLRHNLQVPSQSVQAPNVNSSFLNMFKLFAMIFQQIMAELNGAESDSGLWSQYSNRLTPIPWFLAYPTPTPRYTIILNFLWLHYTRSHFLIIRTAWIIRLIFKPVSLKVWV
jgi:hypothetical protein